MLYERNVLSFLRNKTYFAPGEKISRHYNNNEKITFRKFWQILYAVS